ncbi:MAG: crotonase/enoyl-CoA hydratase family protein [Desulfobacterales bacterium]|nr:crotonase/enoyl-CoA hydratase family protein [Desulfobacterales bacterium]MBF0396948.1 crotonase/enoyl-CoA hydratase family protein [Desulfobacterales bacterium]
MTIRVEKKEQVTTIIIDRPHVRNAVDGQTGEALAQAFRDFESDAKANVAVLYGDHGNFCAGADLKAIANAYEKIPYNLTEQGDGPLGPTRMLLSKPVIAAVSGYAVAGGLELALWCDLRILEKSATLGVFCRRWGVPLIDGGTIRLPRLIGLSRALDLILTGRPVSAVEALEIGLANRVVEDGKARFAAEELASQIASFPQTCLSHDRLSAYEQFSMNISEALVNEFKHGMAVLKSNETVAGAQKFTSGQGRHGSFESIK